MGEAGWTVHILDPATSRPFCGEGRRDGLVHGGLNSSDCSPCIAAAEKEPDAPPKCGQCGSYHHARDAGFFHGETCRRLIDSEGRCNDDDCPVHAGPSENT